ncbi:ABC transporter ATP-binding protein [Desulfatirhabdium butyrativorans]|uniref:ABC transporter ATP-binding protein n=1 Tax=Desulfatirhabdium butyrativorans TaxID=340467 RepID=UPI000A04126E|nr:ABC transporter ATP-binding protein [Desulfatirhabdium butyrativorans]
MVEMPDRFAAEGSPLLTCKGLKKVFNGSKSPIVILDGVDFELHAGQTVAVVGPSGIGKSTFLHLLGGLDRPDGGQIWFQGRDILHLDPLRLARFRNASIGFVFQFHHLLPEFSALENTMMPALIQGMPRKRAMSIAERILERVGLSERSHHRVSLLSGGEQQRVALARALVLNPALLLADEPTGNLDQANGQAVHALLKELNTEYRMSMIVVTHNPDLAKLMQRQVTIQNASLVETT